MWGGVYQAQHPNPTQPTSKQVVTNQVPQNQQPISQNASSARSIASSSSAIQPSPADECGNQPTCYGITTTEGCNEVQDNYRICKREEQLRNQLNVDSNSYPTHVTFTNKEKTELTVCSATLFTNDNNIGLGYGPGDYSTDGFVMKPGETVSLGWGTFVSDDGHRFNPYDKDPGAFVMQIQCEQNGKDRLAEYQAH
jgi:hypothetical protein